MSATEAGAAGGKDVEIVFHGAATTVTGSCMLMRLPGGPVLVDCGLFQGPKALQALNYARLPVDAGSLAAAILTHAHIDHAGMFPRLVREGFRRRAFSTAATCDLLAWVLTDAGAIHESEAERLNRRNRKRGAEDVTPLYTVADAERSLERLAPVAADAWFEPVPGTRARLRNAGHILGSAWLEMEIGGRPGEAPLRFAFSGDLGPPGKSLSFDPAPLDDRPRRSAGGNLVIPSFAVERSQELLHDLLLLSRRREIPPVRIFLDSPLAHRATEVFRRHAKELDIDAGGAAAFDGPNLHVVETVEQSKSIGRVQSGAIIIAGSGMCDAGRVKHHLKDNLWRPQSTVLFVGYQAPGTLGHLIRNGAGRVRIHGEEVAVRARLRSLDFFSGHADRSDLLAWAREAAPKARAIFLVHGEAGSLASLRTGLVEGGADPARIHVPQLDERFVLRGRGEALAVEKLEPDRRRADDELRQALASGRDWHNEYAQTVLDVRSALLAAPDDTTRRRMLDRVKAALSSGR